MYAGGTNRTAFLKLQKVFNFAARLISGRIKCDHISDVLQQLEWSNVEQFLKLNDVCLIHKILLTGEPETLRASLSYNYEYSSRRSRQSHRLYLARASNNHGKRAFTYRAVQSYNETVVSNNIAGLSIRTLKTQLYNVLRRL